MNIRLFLFSCAAVAATSMAGCDTPRTRARFHTGAFAKLTATEKKAVLAGRVHPGMSKEVVYIALGEPDLKRRSADGKEATESWFYRRQLTLKPAMDSFDRWLPGIGVFGPTVPLALRAGFGFGGIGNEGALQTQPHLLITDDTVKRVDFTADRLTAYDLYRFEAAPTR